MLNRKLHEMLVHAEQAELKNKQQSEYEASAHHEWKLQLSTSETKSDLPKGNSIHAQLAKLQSRQLVQQGLKSFNQAVPLRRGKLFGIGRAQYEREKLEKEIEALFAKAEGPVRVTTIFDIQHGAKKAGYPRGEFELANVANGISRAELKRETEDDRIQRKVDKVALLFQIASQYHLRNNPWRKGSDFTLFVMTEFSLYDNAETGPMTVQALNKFKEKLLLVAKNAVQNVHGLVGTMCVNSANVALYVQGGQSPKITNITKAITSPCDAIFQSCRGFMMDEIVIYQNIRILMHELETTYIDLDHLDQLIPYIEKQNRSTCFSLLCVVLRDLRKLVVDSKLSFDQRDEFCDKLEKFNTKIKADIDLASYKKAMAATLPELNRPIKGVAGEFSRIVSCETDQGVKFTPVVDICLDLTLAVGKTTMEMAVLDEMKNFSNLFFGKVSHVVSSATTWIYPHQTLSQCVAFGDSDLKYSGMQKFDKSKKQQSSDENKEMPYTLQKPEKVCVMPYTAFGGTSTLIFSKPIELEALAEDVSHQSFRKALLMLRMLRLRNPTSIKIYDKLIYLHILQFCEDQIRKNNENLGDPKLRTVLMQLNEAQNNIVANTDTDFAELFAAFARVIKAKEISLWRLFDAVQAMLKKEMNDRAQRKDVMISTPEERRLTVRWR